jgi:hypothetical protein
VTIQLELTDGELGHWHIDIVEVVGDPILFVGGAEYSRFRDRARC